MFLLIALFVVVNGLPISQMSVGKTNFVEVETVVDCKLSNVNQDCDACWEKHNEACETKVMFQKEYIQGICTFDPNVGAKCVACSGGNQEVTNGQCCPNDRILEHKETTTTCCEEGQQPISMSPNQPLACGVGVPQNVPPPPPSFVEEETKDACYVESIQGTDLKHGEWYMGCDNCKGAECHNVGQAAGAQYVAWANVYGGFCKVQKDSVTDPDLSTDQGYHYKLYEACAGCQEVTNGQCCPNDRILEKPITTCCQKGQQPIDSGLGDDTLMCGAGVPNAPPPPPPSG